MAATTKYGITLMSTAMVDHETVFNEATTIYDAMVNPSAKSATTTTPPALPELGDLYLLPSGCVGYWTGHDNDIAIYVNGWRFIQPIAGAFVWVEDTTQTYRFDNSTGSWIPNALAITQLTSIPDVDAGALTDGAVLTYNAATSTYALSVLNAGNLNDVDTSAVIDGDTLVWDAATNTWLTGAPSATMTNAEVKTAYEANPDTNAFTDAEQAKLAGLDSSKFLGVFVDLASLQAAHPAPAAGSYAYIDAGAASDIEQYVWDATDSQYIVLAGGGTETSATIKTKYEANPDTNAFTDAEQAKLAGIEDGATADQTGAEIKTAYEANPDTNAFTDAEQAKLSGIEAGATADQTGAEIVTAIDTELGDTTWKTGGSVSAGVVLNTEHLDHASTTPIANATSWNLLGAPVAAPVVSIQDNALQIVGFTSHGAQAGSVPVRMENPDKRPIAGADFDHVMRVNFMSHGLNYGYGAVFVENSTTNTVAAFGVYTHGEFWRMRYTDATFTTGSSLLIGPANDWNTTKAMYVRLQRIGGSLFVYLSQDGLAWAQVHEELLADHVTDIDRVGVLYDADGATANQTGSVIVLGHDDNGPQGRAISGGSPVDVAATWHTLNVVNGDFETGDLTGWAIVGTAPVMAATPWGPTTASNGAWVATGGALSAAGITQDIALGASESTAVLFAVAMDAIKDYVDTDVATIKAEILDGAGNVLASGSRTGPANTVSVSRETLLIPAQAGQETLRITISLTRNSGTNNNCAVDNITVQQYALTGPISTTIMKEDITASYTVTDADLSGQVKHSQNFATSCNIIVPAGLTGKEPCSFIQEGVGPLSFVPDAGVTIKSPRNMLSTVRQYDIATLMPDKKAAGDVYYLSNTTTPIVAPYSPVSGAWTNIVTIAPTVNTYLDGKITVTHTGDMDATVWYTDVPAGDFDIVMRSVLSINSNTYFGCGFFAGTSADIQKIMSVGYLHGTRSAYQWWRLDGATPTYISETAIESLAAFPPLGTVEYWRITRVGTNLTWYRSSDGAVWTQIMTEIEANFGGAIDRIGMLMNTHFVSAGVINTMVLEGYNTNGPQLMP